MNNNLTYAHCGDYEIPNLILSETEAKPLGKYGRMRKNYLKEHRPVLWNSMLLSAKLYPHLREIDETANRRLEQLMSELLTSVPAPDKEKQQMAWVQHMNMLKAQAEEIIFAELIYN
ncbi:MAG: TnpV protein [Bacillota bacterium]|nr:TnpV protein [Bacillota bacterium]